MSARMTASRSTATSSAPTCSGEGLSGPAGGSGVRHRGRRDPPGAGGAWGVAPGVRASKGSGTLIFALESSFCLAWPVLVGIADGNSGRVEVRGSEVGLYALKALLTELTTL